MSDIIHLNEIPKFLQDKIDDAVTEILEDYSKKHNTPLFIGTRTGLYKAMSTTWNKQGIEIRPSNFFRMVKSWRQNEND